MPPSDPETPPPAPSAASFAAVRNWPGYFSVVAGAEPRPTLMEALEHFDGAPPPDATSPPVAIDLGCGEGRDSVELLKRGWRVVAIDAHPEAVERILARDDLVGRERLETRCEPFETVTLPTCDLLNASFAFPFCPPDAFARLWSQVVESIRPGGYLAGQLFGDQDEWASLPDRTHHTRAEAESLLSAFDTLRFEEERCDGVKRWHVFHVVARKRT